MTRSCSLMKNNVGMGSMSELSSSESLSGLRHGAGDRGLNDWVVQISSHGEAKEGDKSYTSTSNAA